MFENFFLLKFHQNLNKNQKYLTKKLWRDTFSFSNIDINGCISLESYMLKKGNVLHDNLSKLLLSKFFIITGWVLNGLLKQRKINCNFKINCTRWFSIWFQIRIENNITALWHSFKEWLEAWKFLTSLAQCWISSIGK